MGSHLEATSQPTGKILVVDDEPDIGTMISGILRDEGHSVVLAKTAAEGLSLFSKELPDVCFLDVWLPDGDGLDILEKMRAVSTDTSVVMMSGHANIETAVRSTRVGALDFLEKPLSLEKIVVTVQNALKISRLRQENNSLRNRVEQKYRILGRSKAIESIRNTIDLVSKKSTTVLITGENGTGKENVARAIHEQSQRGKMPFVAVNCAAIPDELIEAELFGHEKGAFTGASSSRKGKFELAHGGTLFLDEVGDMSLKAQAKVLRALQEQKIERVGGSESIHVQVMVISATNKNISEEIKNGRFREDLFYRLNVIPIELPPLRERLEDIQLIAQHYLEYYSLENGGHPKILATETIEKMKNYSWPGNIRELKNLMERLSILVDENEILPRHLPHPMKDLPRSGNSFLDTLLSHADFRLARLEFEKAFIMRKLEECSGNVTRTADMIGMERSHLYRKLKQFDEMDELGKIISTKDE